MLVDPDADAGADLERRVGAGAAGAAAGADAAPRAGAALAGRAGRLGADGAGLGAAAVAAGAAARGRQKALLSRLAHERSVDPALGHLLDKLGAAAHVAS